MLRGRLGTRLRTEIGGRGGEKQQLTRQAADSKGVFLVALGVHALIKAARD